MRPVRTNCPRRLLSSSCRRSRAEKTALAGWLIGATCLSLAPSVVASATTTSGLRAQAAAITATISTDNASLRAVGIQYLTDQATYQNDLTRVGIIKDSLVGVQSSVTHERNVLRSAALNAYVGSGAVSTVGLFLVSRPDDLTSRNAYLAVATNELQSTITTLSGDEQRLTTSLAAEQQAAGAAMTALAASEQERSSALSTLRSEQQTLGSVSGQLATLVAAQAAAAERAAQAAAEARAAAAAAAATATATAAAATAPSTATTTSSTSAPAAPPSAGPPAPTAVTQVTPGAPPASLAADFLAIRNCESSDDYSLNTGNGYYGAYQFSASTWLDLGGTGLASSATPAAQDAAAYRLYLSGGWSSWPACAAIAGL